MLDGQKPAGDDCDASSERGLLYATALGRTATVVGKRSYVNDFSNFDACTVNGTDS